MARPASVRFKKESEQCEVAAKTAAFLESYVPSDYYDFALPDLLYFQNEKALLELRENSVWQALEGEFTGAGGLISEDWDDWEDSKPVKVLRPVRRWKSRAVGLVVVIITPAIVGAVLGWLYPYKLLPKINCSVVEK
jgi:hypothetical protein